MLLLQFLDIYGTVPSTPVIDIHCLHFGSFKYVATFCFALTCGSSDWDELSNIWRHAFWIFSHADHYSSHETEWHVRRWNWQNVPNLETHSCNQKFLLHVCTTTISTFVCSGHSIIIQLMIVTHTHNFHHF